MTHFPNRQTARLTLIPIYVAMIWRAYGNNSWMGHTGGGNAGVTASMDIDPNVKVGVIILCDAPGRFAVMPGGAIYQLLHAEAQRFGQSNLARQRTLTLAIITG